MFLVLINKKSPFGEAVITNTKSQTVIRFVF